MKSSFLLFIVLSIVIFFVIIIFNNNLKNKIHYASHYTKDTTKGSVFDIKHLLNSRPCKSSETIICVVTSYIEHVELRSAHRRALPSELLHKIGIKRVFLLAKSSGADKFGVSQESIRDESARFGDILQGDFLEAYRNLTYKHIMGLKWATENCPDADFIIKLDDDIVFNINNLLKYIKAIRVDNRFKFILGYVLRGMKVIRNKANKWYVTKTEYKKSFYPPFVSGWMYVTVPETAKNLVAMAMSTPYFWIDDVYVTGILAAKNGIQLTDVRYDKILLEYYELMDCCLNDMVNKNITCEYSVGPNGGNNNMLVKFVEAVDHCSVKHCKARPMDTPLTNTCVSLKKPFPLDKGSPVVNILKLK